MWYFADCLERQRYLSLVNKLVVCLFSGRTYTCQCPRSAVVCWRIWRQWWCDRARRSTSTAPPSCTVRPRKPLRKSTVTSRVRHFSDLDLDSWLCCLLCSTVSGFHLARTWRSIAGIGVKSAIYHAGLGTRAKRKTHHDFLNDKVKVWHVQIIVEIT